MYFVNGAAGWPSGRGEPPVRPVSFDFPRFVLPAGTFRDVEPPAGKMAVTSTARAFIGAVREVHKDPIERNMYINPNRHDQALVFTDKWAPRMLDSATKSLFDHIIKAIESELASCDADRKKTLSAMY